MALILGCVRGQVNEEERKGKRVAQVLADGVTVEAGTSHHISGNRPLTTRINSPRDYCSFAYSDLAAMKIGMSGSASFHSVRKSR